MANKLIILVAVAIAQASPASAFQDANAQSEEVGANDSEDKVKKDKKNLICKRYAKTGTRVSKKVCYTRAQWDRIRDHAQRFTTQVQDRAVAPGRTGG